MDKKTFEERVKRSIQVQMFVFQSKNGRNTQPKISNLNFNWWKPSDGKNHTCELYFEGEFTFNTPDPDIGSFNNELDKFQGIQFRFFKDLELFNDGEFRKREISLDDSDDIIGLFLSSSFDWTLGGEANNTTVKFGYEYSAWDIELES